MEFKIIRELGSGGNGTVYLIDHKKEKLVYKLERMDKFNKKKPLTSEYYRQIKFNEDIAIDYPDKFMILRSHGIIYNCDYKHPEHDEFMKYMDDERKKRYLRKSSQPNCYYLIYSPYLKGSFNEVKDEIHKSKKLLKHFMYSIIDSINIMRKKGYQQNDPNGDNIMYSGNINNPQWYIIDYGNMCNKSFPKSELDKDIQDRELYCQDLLMFVRSLINPQIMTLRKKHKLKFPPRKDAIKKLQKTFEFKEASKHINHYSTKIQNGMTIPLMQLLYPQVFMKIVEFPEKIYKNFKSKQLCTDIILYIIKHANDKTYDGILRYIKI